MNQIDPKHFLILALAPTAKGVGFAVLEGRDTLVDWGIKTVRRNKNANPLANVEKLVTQYRPGMLVLENIKTYDSRCSPRVRKLGRQIIKMAATHNVDVKMFSRDEVMKSFITDGRRTKHALAEIIAQRFPEELNAQLPPKRKAWMRQDFRMGIFDAVALALRFLLKNQNSARGLAQGSLNPIPERGSAPFS